MTNFWPHCCFLRKVIDKCGDYTASGNVRLSGAEINAQLAIRACVPIPFPPKLLCFNGNRTALSILVPAFYFIQMFQFHFIASSLSLLEIIQLCINICIYLLVNNFHIKCKKSNVSIALIFLSKSSLILNLNGQLASSAMHKLSKIKSRFNTSLFQWNQESCGYTLMQQSKQI